jgi:hypothetical protein
MEEQSNDFNSIIILMESRVSQLLGRSRSRHEVIDNPKLRRASVQYQRERKRGKEVDA